MWSHLLLNVWSLASVSEKAFRRIAVGILLFFRLSKGLRGSFDLAPSSRPMQNLTDSLRRATKALGGSSVAIVVL